MGPLAVCVLALVPVTDCAPAARQYEPAVALVRAADWRLVSAVAIDPFNRGSSNGTGITLPNDPHSTGADWILAHEVAHVRQRIDSAWWAAWYRADLPPCTIYGATSTAENQSETYAAATTGRVALGCEQQARWILDYDR